jgi:FkbM family methyltransferase
VKRIGFHRLEIKFYANNYEEIRIAENIFKKSAIEEIHMLSSLLQILYPGDIAYDIGANRGIHTIFMAKKVGERGKIIAVEPERKNYEALRQNISLNNLNNIIPIELALGDKFDTGNLYVIKRIGNSSVSLFKSESGTFCQDVKIVPGDFLVQERNLPLPRVVKIDVEGYEYPVIKGLEKTLSTEICQLVCCEIHSHLSPPGANGSMVIDLLKSLGFKKIESYNRGGEIHAICYKNKISFCK